VVAVILITVSFVALYAGSNLNKNTPRPIINIGPVGLPEQLLIPSIEVNTKIQSVGLDSKGRIGIPNNYTDVAWYNLGPKPGDRGSSIITGHLDALYSADAVFARLSELKKGDEIYITDEAGKKIKFIVTRLESYDYDSAPLKEILNQNVSTSNLNIITCDGTWNKEKRTYDNRLVVYSTRVL